MCCPRSWRPCLFAGAGIAFIQSGGELVNLAQPLAGALISFVIVSTVCWEWKLLGNPKKVGPLVAHITLFAAVFLMINALYVRAEETRSLVGGVVEAFAWTSKLLTGIPDAVFDIIRSPSIALLFLGACLALAVPRRTWAIGLLIGVSGLGRRLGAFEGDHRLSWLVLRRAGAARDRRCRPDTKFSLGDVLGGGAETACGRRGGAR